MKKIISAGAIERVIFDDTHDGEQELIFELSAYSSLELVVVLSGKIPELVVSVHLLGVHAQAHIKGAYILKDTQKIIFKTQQFHRAPHTSSSCTVKGILYDASFAQYHGTINVDSIAHHTNAKQINKNILLSSTARAQSVPCLEVLTKHVQCSHGSAVGNLDKEILFYMQARGLSQSYAQKILLEGFIGEIVDALPRDTATHIKKMIA